MSIFKRIGSVAALLLAPMLCGACSKEKPPPKEEPMPKTDEVARAPKEESKKPPPPKTVVIEWARFTPDGKKIITFETDRVLNVWDANKDKKTEEDTLPEATLAKDLRLIADPLLVKDFVLLNEGGVVVLLNWKTGKEEWRTDTRGKVQSAYYTFFPTANDEVVGISANSVVNINLKTGVVRRRVDLPFEAYSKISAVTPAGDIGIIAEVPRPFDKQTSLHFVDLITGKKIKSISDDKRRVVFVFISPDGKRALTILNNNKLQRGYCEFLDVEKCVSLGEFELDEKSRRNVLNSRPNRALVDSRFERLIVTFDGDGDLRGSTDVVTYDIEKRKKTSEFQQDSVGVSSAALSPDGQSLLLAGGRFWRQGTKPKLRPGNDVWQENRAMAIYDLKKGSLSRTIVFPLRGED